MRNLNFTEIANNVGVMYSLLLIAFLLIYIAFYKKPSSKTTRRVAAS